MLFPIADEWKRCVKPFHFSFNEFHRFYYSYRDSYTYPWLKIDMSGTSHFWSRSRWEKKFRPGPGEKKILVPVPVKKRNLVSILAGPGPLCSSLILLVVARSPRLKSLRQNSCYPNLFYIFLKQSIFPEQSHVDNLSFERQFYLVHNMQWHE